jgi:chaperonin GroEL (HSP60 family)
MRQAQNADERAAYNILLQAIEVPIRTLLSNAGYSLRMSWLKLSPAA